MKLTAGSTPPEDGQYTPRNIQYSFWLKVALLICGMAIINIWPIANSIAARNIALALGAICALILFFGDKKNWSFVNFLSPLLLFGLLGWMIILYLFKPLAPETQWSEITSTWLRVALAILLGSGLGFCVAQSKAVRFLALLSFLPLLIAQLLTYLYHSYLFGSLSTPYTPGIFITKAGGTYFLMWPYLLLCAYTDFLLNTVDKNTGSSYTVVKIGACLLMFSACFLAFYSLASLNGILISGVCVAILMIRVFFNLMVLRKHKMLGLIAIAVVIAISSFAIHMYSKQDGNKFNNLLQDLKIGVQVDRYTNWRNDTPALVPVIPDHPPINQSTYFRIANFINGARLIAEHPLGAGFTYLPYGYYMSRLYPGSVADHTHSGWIDFALGVGIPGIILCWLAIAWAIWVAIKQQKHTNLNGITSNLWSYIVIWGLGGIWLLWIVLEVSEKEYIEHLMFMIAFLAAGNASTPNPQKAATT